jgi:hypothetical protein
MSGVRIAWFISSTAAIAVAGICSSIVHQKIWSLVGSEEPGQSRPLGWSFTKISRLYAAYRSSYPDGNLVRLIYLLCGCGAAGLISAAAAMGFFGSLR